MQKYLQKDFMNYIGKVFIIIILINFQKLSLSHSHQSFLFKAFNIMITL